MRLSPPVRTELDEDGRPLRSLYPGAEERYGYDELDEEELSHNLWYLIGDGGGLSEIERYEIPAELDGFVQADR